MKIAIAYPPIPSGKGVPLISQNRQFQWFHTPTYIYPVVPSCAATMAKKAGHDVYWLDGIAEEWSALEFSRRAAEIAPDLMVIEAKTPIINAYWAAIDKLKLALPRTKFVLVGDHVTALPAESFGKCNVDFVLTGGDHDFLLINLLAHITSGKALEPGIWYRKDGEVKNTGKFVLEHDLRGIPWIDRDLTHWKLYSERNGNFRKTPGTYIMSGRDCWHGKCTFCSWTTLYPSFRARDPIDVVNEIGDLIERYKVKEIMDDTGTFPVGEWLNTFCHEMIKRGYNKRVNIDCNMRFGRLKLEDYKLMKEAGFRFMLFGLESANQATLDRLKKGIKVANILDGAEAASSAGLDVHVTVMFGYPWETSEDIGRTVALARELLIRGIASTLQVTLVIPYPGTPLFRELEAGNQLLTSNWDDFDMRMNVMKGNVGEDEIKAAIRKVYRGFLNPMAIWNRIVHTHHLWDDIKFYWRGFLSLTGHLRDFK
jgi:radical SAM superfamily enzyme YgiQ (UPF0313 family)